MIWLDIVIVLVWAAAGLWGYFNGVLGLVLPFVGMLVGLAVGSRYGDNLGDTLFSGVTESADVQRFAGFLVIVAVCAFGGGVLAFILRSILTALPIASMANKVMGLAVGIILGFVVLSGIFTGIQKYPVADIDHEIEDSKLAAFLADNFDIVIRGIGLIPADWDQDLPRF